MRMLAVIATGLLAGCGGEPDAATTNLAAPILAQSDSATGGPARGAVGGGPVTLEPGRWRTKVDVTSVEMPGMPASVQAQARETMKAQSSTTTTSCLSAETARRPPSELFAGQPPGACRANSLSLAGGRITGELDCDQQGVRTRVSLAGTASPTRFDTEVASRMSMSGMSVSVTARSVGERIGACAPGEK